MNPPTPSHPMLEGVKTLERFKSEVRDATRKAVDESFDYTRSLLADFTERACQDIASKLEMFEKPPILQVQVNGGELRKLKHRASPVLPALIRNAKLGFNTLLVGPAGCGKTTVAEQLAEALGLPFGHLCLTAGASETWLFGRQTPNGFVEGSFSKLYRSGGVFLADEIDAADSNMTLSLNSAIANGAMYNPISGENIPRHSDFHFVGAANTFGKGADEVYTGRNRLDGATLDRFILIKCEYSREIEKDLCPDEVLRAVLWGLRDTVQTAKSTEVVSTRQFDRAFKLLSTGVQVGEIVETLTLSWPEELREKAILDAKEKAKKALAKQQPKGKKALPAPGTSVDEFFPPVPAKPLTDEDLPF